MNNRGRKPGFVTSEETREKMRRAKLGYVMKQETKDKIAAKLRGRNPTRFVRVMIKETGQVFGSMSEAARYLNTEPSTVSRYAKTGKTFNGSTFVVITETPAK